MKYKGAKKQHIGQKVVEGIDHKNEGQIKELESRRGQGSEGRVLSSEAQHTCFKRPANRQSPGFIANDETLERLRVDYGLNK